METDRLEILRKRHKRIHRNALNLLIGWTLFHLFAVFVSYCQISIFNPNGLYSTRKFWPFVDFYHKVESGPRTHMFDNVYRLETTDVFNGLFVNYDLTEFLFYIAFGGILFLLFKRWTRS